MMPLRLQVVLSALDKASKPFRSLTAGSSRLAGALRSQRDTLKTLQAAQRDIGSFRQQAGAVRQMAAAHGAAQDKVRQLAAQMAAADRPSRQLDRRFQAAVKTASALKLKHQQGGVELQRLRSTLDRAGISTRDLTARERALRGQISVTTTAIRHQQSALAQLADRQQRVARYQKGVHRAAGFGRDMAASGALMAGSMYGFARSLTGVVTAGASFEAQMSRVQALTRLDRNSEALDALRAQARMLGATTSFKASEAAQGQGFLAMAGFTPKAIQQAMPAMLDMAKAGGIQLARTADISSNILSGFGLEADQMGRVADVLTLGFSTANTNLEMLGDTMKYVAPIAKASGVSLEESVAMAGLLGNVGIQSSQAGTTLRSMLLRLASPSSKAAVALGKLNVQTQDSSGNMRSMLDITSEVARAVERLGNGQRLSVLKDIFGEEPAAGMAELIERAGAGEIEKYRALLQGADGTAARVAGIMDDNLQGRWRTLSSSVESLMITVTELVSGPLSNLASLATTVARRLQGWLEANSGLARSALLLGIAVGSIAAVVTTLMLVLGSVLGPIAFVGRAVLGLATHAETIGTAVSTAVQVGLRLPSVLAAASGPLLAIGAAVVLVAALVWKYWEPIKAFLVGTWQGLMQAFAPVLGELRSALAPLAPLWETMTAAGAIAATWLQRLVQPFQATTEQLQGATAAGRSFGQVIGSVLAFNVRMAISVVGVLVKAFMAVLPAVHTAFSETWQYLQGAWSLIVGVFTLNGGRIREGMMQMWNGVNTLLLGWPARMQQAGVDMLAGLINGIASMGGAVRDAVASIAGNVVDRFKNLLGIHSPSRVFARLGMDTMDGLAIGLSQQAERPLQQLLSLGERMRTVGAGAALVTASAPFLATAAPIGAAHASPTSAATAPAIYNITIHAAPGTDARSIAAEVRRQLDARDRQQAARHASRLTD